METTLAFDRAVIHSSERVQAARAAQHFVTPPDPILQTYCEAIATYTKSQMSFVTLVFEESHHVIAEWGFPDDGDLTVPGEREGTFTRTACAFLVAAGKPVSFHDTHNFEILQECLALETVRSYTAAPLRFRGQVIGSFGVCDLRPRSLSKKQFAHLIELAEKISNEFKEREI